MNTARILISVFLIAHGLIHMSLATVPLPKPGEMHTPFWPAWWRDAIDPIWLASRLGLSPALVRTAGWLLWLVVTAAYALAGLGLLGVPGLYGLWKPLAAGASVLSLVLLALYWHPWLVMAVAINLALLGGIYSGLFSHWLHLA
jgi:hypothetical protein